MTEAILSNIILGESGVIRELRALIMRVAPLDLPVVVQGPTGAGKELVAQALHAASGRVGKSVAFNVCAVPDAMFEDALFGHVRGAFTGATSDALGYLLEADRGTIFLDEIGGLSLPLQAKLLRVIETRRFRPVGARADRTSDFRVIAATNQPLDELVEEGLFRSDLMHRLCGIVISVPPLRERVEDIPIIARHFLRTVSAHSTPPEITDDAIRVLQEYDWPGNVRELRHTLERAVALHDGRTIGPDDIKATIGGFRRRHSATSTSPSASTRMRLFEVLDQLDWDTQRAASHLGVHRSTIYRWMQKYGIKRPSFHYDTTSNHPG